MTESTWLHSILNVLTQLRLPPTAAPWVLKLILPVIGAASIGLWATYDLWRYLPLHQTISHWNPTCLSTVIGTGKQEISSPYTQIHRPFLMHHCPPLSQPLCANCFLAQDSEIPRLQVSAHSPQGLIFIPSWALPILMGLSITQESTIS